MPATLARLAAPMVAATVIIAATATSVRAQLAPRIAAGATAITAPDGSTVPDSSTLRVFIDHCPCRMDYVRLEIPYVDYVRDRTEAQVHVLFTQQRTGSGGRSYTLEFIGLGRFEGRLDTMRLATRQDATDDERREALIRYLKLGLVPFLNETRAVNQLDVTYTPPANGIENTGPTADPWNFWVFRTNLNGSGSSEASAKRVSTNGSFTADRTTQQWHLRFNGRGDYTERRYNFTDGSKLTSYTNSYDASAFIVKSRGPHWSLGGTASLHSSTTDNQRDALRVAPGGAVQPLSL